MNESRFYYFICNEGSEPFLKEEIKLFFPDLKFSFSTKGFITYKLADNRKAPNLNIVFCRHFGNFINRGTESDMLLEFENLKGPKFHYKLSGEVIRQDSYSKGDYIYELIEVRPNEYYLGGFWSSGNKIEFPGGRPVIEHDANSPSRAYLKILEGAALVDVDFKASEVALEIGSSPGGATYALLKKGLNVIGVDPGIMHPICFNFSTFSHHQISIQDFSVKKLTKKIDWLLVDMNLAPEASLNEIEKIFEAIRNDFQGAFITLKMTKISLVNRLPFYRKILTRLGLEVVTMCQLPSHKQEFLLYVKGSK